MRRTALTSAVGGEPLVDVETAHEFVARFGCDVLVIEGS
jgi:hypothetical protein